MANINFGMVSDHSDNEFNYPDEVEKFSDKENIGPQQKENQQKAQFTIASVQKYILTQRSQNTVKKKTEYEVHDKNSKLNTLKDREFLKSREVLLSKKKQLIFEEWKGNRPHAAKELSNAEEDLLFRTGEFGAENPEALQRTV